MERVIDNEYATLLNSDEWKAKKNTILKRDSYKCTKCNLPESTWVPHSGASGGRNVLIIENEPVTDFPKTVEIVNNPIYLHIHHKFYVIENRVLADPWDYKDEDLITVCNKCHEQIHREEKVPIYQRKLKEFVETNEYKLCPRCGGEGYLPEYSHVQNGICFKCEGKSVFKIFEI